jgi:hypothetical protein
MRRAILAFLLLPLAASGAFAQSAGDLAGLKRYVGTQAYVGLLVEAAVAGEVQAAPECSDIKPVDRTEFTVFMPPSFGNGPHPVAGMWRDRLKIMRCGVVAYQNVVFIAQPNGPPQTALMLPGLTSAPPQLQQAALPKAAAVARARANCNSDDVAVIDTKPDLTLRPVTKVAPNGMALDGQWREIWQLRACGKPASVTLIFTADGVGGAFTEAK